MFYSRLCQAVGGVSACGLDDSRSNRNGEGGVSSLVHAWWGVSLAAGALGVGGGVASAPILGLGWTLLANGYPIVYCPPRCPEGAPLTDVAHVASIVFGIAAPAAASWALWRRRARVGWVLPAVAVVLVAATIWALAGAAVAP